MKSLYFYFSKKYPKKKGKEQTFGNMLVQNLCLNVKFVFDCRYKIIFIFIF